MAQQWMQQSQLVPETDLHGRKVAQQQQSRKGYEAITFQKPKELFSQSYIYPKRSNTNNKKIPTVLLILYALLMEIFLTYWYWWKACFRILRPFGS